MANEDQKDDELLEEVAMGHPGALLFLKAITFIVHIWDDLIDRDKPVTDEDISKAFQIALIELPANEFYMENIHRLHPIMVVAMYNWHAATEMERFSVPGDLQIAFILRSSYVDLVTMVAWIVGGDKWAREMTPKIRRAAHKEGFKGYIKNLEAEMKARREN